MTKDASPASGGGNPLRVGQLQLESNKSAVDESVLNLIAGIVGLSRVSITDNFLTIGGSSLLANRLAARIKLQFGVRVPVVEILRSSTLQQIADAIESPRPDTDKSALLTVRGQKDSALSFGQLRLWFLDQMGARFGVYVVPLVLRLTGELNLPLLKQSLEEIARRHQILRTRYPASDGIPRQIVDDRFVLRLEVTNLQSNAEIVRNAEIERIVVADSTQAFDLAHGPLMRLRLIRCSARQHVLVITIHHIATDGWSSDLLIGELARYYRAFAAGRDSARPLPKFQYCDYAEWQRSRLGTVSAKAQLAFWRKQLDRAPVLNLLTDRPRPPTQTFQGRNHRFAVDEELTQRLMAMSRRHGSTLFMTLMAAFMVLLQRYTGQDDIVVGTPVAGRDRAEFEELIGFFVNTVALRGDLSDNPTFSVLLRRVRETALAAYANEEIPFEQVVEALQPERDLSRSPLFQTMLVLETEPPAAAEAAGLTLTRVRVLIDAAKYDLTVFLVPCEKGLDGWFEYNSDLFDPVTIARMAGHFTNLLRSIAFGGEQTNLADLPLLSQKERTQLVVDWNRTARFQPAGGFVRRFENQVERAPQSSAVAFADVRLTYDQLNRRANQLAHHLKKHGVGPDVLVGIYMERCPEMLVSLLGILKAGGAYLPLHPTFPLPRLKLMWDEAGRPLVLTEGYATEHLGFIPEGMQLKITAPELIDEDDTNPDVQVDPDNLAYVIFTSGSTGRPKGVMVPRGGLDNYLEWCLSTYEMHRARRAIVHSPITFDLTITGLLAPLLQGVCVHLLSEADGLQALPYALRSLQGVSIVKLTPAHLELIRSSLRSDELAALSAIFIVGGERLLAQEANFWQQFATETCITNEYGPTETVVGACAYKMGPAAETGYSVPIGRPIDNTRMLVLDRHLEPVPIGVAGELYVGGAGVARGYLGAPDLTADRFVADAFCELPGQRLYRTGDLVRYKADGNLDFLGRVDDQVKIRGFRVEPGEIEQAIRLLPGVDDVAVLTVEDQTVGRRLAAYVVACAGAIVDGSVLRAMLAERLPEYMIPTTYVQMTSLPLTPNGKLDRAALPRVQLGITKGPAGSLQGTTENDLAAIWSKVLGIKNLGRHDNFFHLGGHSLLVMQVLSRIKDRFGVEITARAFFAEPSVCEIAKQVDRLDREGSHHPGGSIKLSG